MQNHSEIAGAYSKISFIQKNVMRSKKKKIIPERKQKPKKYTRKNLLFQKNCNMEQQQTRIKNMKYFK